MSGNGNHPAWNLGKTAVMFGGLALLLWMNSTKFDITELKVLLELLILRGAWEGFERKARRKTDG